MLAKKSKKARQKREEVDRVILDMDTTAFPLEYQMVRQLYQNYGLICRKIFKKNNVIM